MSTFLVHITGNPNIPTLAKVNLREQPGTSGVGIRFQADIGTRNLPVLDVKPDQANNALNGKVYQWFQVRVPQRHDRLAARRSGLAGRRWHGLRLPDPHGGELRLRADAPTTAGSAPCADARTCPGADATTGHAADAHTDAHPDANTTRRSQGHGDQRERAEPARSADQRAGDHAAGVQRGRQDVADAPARRHQQLHLGAGRRAPKALAGCEPTI